MRCARAQFCPESPVRGLALGANAGAGPPGGLKLDRIEFPAGCSKCSTVALSARSLYASSVRACPGATAQGYCLYADPLFRARGKYGA